MSNRALLSMMGAIAVCAGCGGAAATSSDSPTEPETTPSTQAATQAEGSTAATEPEGQAEAAAKGPEQELQGTVVLWCREGSDHTRECAPPDEGLLQAKPLLSVVQQNESALQTCAGGKSDAPVRVHIHIDGEGAVSAVQTPGSQLDDETRGCLEEAVRGWSFPAPEAGEVVIEYPLEPASAVDAAD